MLFLAVSVAVVVVFCGGVIARGSDAAMVVVVVVVVAAAAAVVVMVVFPSLRYTRNQTFHLRLQGRSPPNSASSST